MAVLFKNVKSIYPKPLASSWEQLKELLSFHEVNAEKAAGALWSPVEYDAGTTRGNRNVRFVEALVVTWTVKRLTMQGLMGWSGLRIRLIRIGWMILTITWFYR